MIDTCYLRCSVNMSLVIALKGCVQSIGINEKYNPSDDNKNIEGAQPGQGMFHRLLLL